MILFIPNARQTRNLVPQSTNYIETAAIECHEWVEIHAGLLLLCKTILQSSAWLALTFTYGEAKVLSGHTVWQALVLRDYCTIKIIETASCTHVLQERLSETTWVHLLAWYQDRCLRVCSQQQYSLIWQGIEWLHPPGGCRWEITNYALASYWLCKSVVVSFNSSSLQPVFHSSWMQHIKVVCTSSENWLDCQLLQQHLEWHCLVCT